MKELEMIGSHKTCDYGQHNAKYGCYCQLYILGSNCISSGAIQAVSVFKRDMSVPTVKYDITNVFKIIVLPKNLIYDEFQ